MTVKVFSGVRAPWLPLYEKLRGMVTDAVGEFEEHETAAAMLWKHSSTFAEVSAKKSAMVVACAADTLHADWNPNKTLQTSKSRVVHYFEVTDDAGFEALVERIKAAYELTKTARAVKREPKTEYATVDEYISAFPEQTADVLQKIRNVIRAAAPDATEKMSWQMPTYHLGENMVHFAAAKNHISLFPTPEAVEAFAGRLTQYKTTKGGIQFPRSSPPPYDLIGEITRWRAERLREKYGREKEK